MSSLVSGVIREEERHPAMDWTCQKGDENTYLTMMVMSKGREGEKERERKRGREKER